MLNIGLLTPKEVIDAALSTRKKIPLNSLEGFVRQIIGWREFMHGIYRHRGVEIRTENFFNHTRPIPECFYDGTTGIPPIDRIIRQLHDEAYCHHIERLMILGNFMLLCRFDPRSVYKWFMERFIDAVRLGHGPECLRHVPVRRWRHLHHKTLHIRFQLRSQDVR